MPTAIFKFTIFNINLRKIIKKPLDYKVLLCKYIISLKEAILKGAELKAHSFRILWASGLKFILIKQGEIKNGQNQT